MKRTTIIADDALLLDAKYLAAREGKTFTDVVREALREYVAAHQEAPALSIVGIGHSGEADTSERVDEILKAEATPEEGWTPRHRPSHSPAQSPSPQPSPRGRGGSRPKPSAPWSPTGAG